MTMMIHIDDVPQLQQRHCYMAQPQRVEKLLNELAIGGHAKLQLITDFDFTITKQHRGAGKPMLTSFCILDQCDTLPDWCRERSLELVRRFKPIEIDPHLSIADKVTAMQEWWRLSSALHKGFPLAQSDLAAVARRHMDDCLRDGTADMFADLNERQVPILVFSAGLGDSVCAVLDETNIRLANVKVVSNFLQYKDGLLDGFDMDHMIHSFNKNESVLQGTDYYDSVHDRTNVLLMGDSLGDADMSNGSPASANILKIGFLYEHIETNLPKYMKAFDIVLVDDQTMDVPRAILALVQQ